MFAYVCDNDFNQQQLYHRLQQDAQRVDKGNVGAIVTFTGLVRDSNSNGHIKGIELEHYPGMTEKALTDLVNLTIERFSLISAGAVHRVGKLYNDEQIVWVGCAAPHRASSFEAASFLMDMLKQSVPLWKKEFSDDGDAQWVEVKASDHQAAMAWMKNK